LGTKHGGKELLSPQRGRSDANPNQESRTSQNNDNGLQRLWNRRRIEPDQNDCQHSGSNNEARDNFAGFCGNNEIASTNGSGNANAGLVSFKFEETDFSVAVPVQGDILDKEIADHYLKPGDTIRGWAFFEYPSSASMPVRLSKIRDDLGHAYSFEIPDEAGSPGGDSLRREFVLSGPTMNLSSCTRLAHPGPVQ